ncbi:two-component system, OmpR family, sensor histidine kinase MtrB [Amycolatopsis marina]|uniref:histidine kinase n=1 Tax=Amycolatopsis marina TaxID=490629 RepID=A0A1I1AYH4_9PSEU|nr:HAMP domain-containing sensor histidine kinase [Amycolatopsis marina]SFB43145.1 two-component system, OmpR family, sensor histidine kinase MtrB [Amycolatopsis marina]
MRPRLPHLGLRTRIVIAVVLVTTVATTGMAFTAYQLQAEQTTKRFTAAAQAGFNSDLQAVLTRVHNNTWSNRTEAAADYMRGREGVSWGLFDFYVDGRQEAVDGYYPPESLAAGSDSFRWPADLINQAREGESASKLVESADDPAFLLAEEVMPGFVLAQRYSMRSLWVELSSLQRILVLVAVVATVLGIVAALIAARRIQRPVRAVAAAARDLGGGALDIRLPVRGRDELADLTGSFNAMAQRLGESIEQLKAKDRQQRRFVADVAHDLRTPIGTMVAAADSLEHQDPASRARSAQLLGDQARRVARLVEDLLEISRFDAGVAELRPEPVDLRALLTDVIELIAADAEIRISTYGDGIVIGDPRRLHTLVGNLIANTLRHGAEPVTVTIDGRDPETVTIEVADHGPGVPEDLVPIVFDRFVRGDQARGPTGGSGLGLSIAQENAAAHGGRIEVGNREGAVFTVVLPRTARTSQEDAGQI